MVGEQYIGRLCVIFADDARERGVMGGLRLPPLQTSSGIDRDMDGEEGSSQDLDGYAAPSPAQVFKPLLRLVISQSDSMSSKQRKKLLKFAFDDVDGKLSVALNPTPTSRESAATGEGGIEIDDMFESAAMASRDVILEWLNQVSAGEVESF